MTYPDGTRLTLQDIAEIDDGFVETEGFSRFNGETTAMLQVVAGAQQNEIQTAADVKALRRGANQAGLPDDVSDGHLDRSAEIPAGQPRPDAADNIVSGCACSYFVVLSLFLRMKVAFWVIVGLPITFSARCG